MYIITIKTKFNTIHLEVEDYNTPEVQEIFNQPYVEEIRMQQVNGQVSGQQSEQVSGQQNIKYKKLIKNDKS